MNRFFVFLFALSFPLTAAAQGDCYHPLYNKGLSEFNAGRWDNAILKWKGAKDCPDKPANNDLDSRIRKAEKSKSDEVAERMRRKEAAAAERKRQAEIDRQQRETASAVERNRAADKADDDAWDIIKDSRDTTVFRRYMEKYPNGRHAVAAQKRITELSGDTKSTKNTTTSIVPSTSPLRAGDVADDGLVFVKGGTFTMGPASEHKEKKLKKSENNDPIPTRHVTLSDFYIGKYEVTQKQWREIMGSNPSFTKNCENCPVDNIDWDDIQGFLRKINTANPGKNYRLPTEAEWEYAARGGSLSKGYTYSGSNSIGDVAWNPSSKSKTYSIGSKKANELGLYDMSGNAWEWCNDAYGRYPSQAETNPKGPIADRYDYRVLRGGEGSRTTDRRKNKAKDGDPGLGFRLARSY